MGGNAKKRLIGRFFECMLFVGFVRVCQEWNFIRALCGFSAEKLEPPENSFRVQPVSTHANSPVIPG